ncbi:MAG: glycosyltransferase [Bacteroidales bacterium]
MKLSIIIVNYNVKCFLEQCLYSVLKSIHIDMEDLEIFVVDNHSVDGSVEMVQDKFPKVKIIANLNNTGFAAANNQAIRVCTGKYILLLNPDTLVEDDTLFKCLQFMEKHLDAGGLGVKMIDGEGRYMPESKRGIPLPIVALYKISGLCKLFPRSKRFARYYMGHLSKDEIQEVEILSGAFMMMPRAVLQKVGLLDETFFMYGEDIDLSYRILLGGYKNYYFPQTRIVHYKGESTKKGSLNYVVIFYKAMEIFARKYFSDKHTKTYLHLVRFAIWARAGLAVMERLLKKIFLPFCDMFLNYGLLLALSTVWAKEYFGTTEHFSEFYRQVVLPLYSVVFVGSLALLQAYKRPISLIKMLYGYLLGMVLLLLGFALLGSDFQYSRLVIVGGSVLCFSVSVLYRLLLGRFFANTFNLALRPRRYYLLVGGKEEMQRAQSILEDRGARPDRIFSVVSEKASENMMEAIQIYKISEVIFCAKDMSFAEIIYLMDMAKKAGCSYKIISPDGEILVGSRLEKY